MNYIIFGTEEYLIKKRINKLLNKFFDNGEKNINNFDCLEDSFEDFLLSLEQTSLDFLSKKAVVLYNADFLSVDKENKKITPSIYQRIINFCKSKDENTLLILVTNKEKLLKKNNIVEFFENNEKIYSFLQITKSDYLSYFSRYFTNKGYRISEDTINLIYEYLNNDLYVFENEANKLMLYKAEDKLITKKDVQNLTSRNINDNIFELRNAILSKDSNKILTIYNDLKTIGTDPITLINIISSNFIFYDEVLFLSKCGRSDAEISSTLNVHPYRVTASLKNLKRFDLKEIQDFINKLHELDKSIKNMEIDRFLGFELFLSNI